MVVPLRPGKFYGSSLPRPRFYTDVKFNDERVDPPVSVLDPLMSWANEAHWSMGGLCLKRLRLQGKIEGNVKKLRKERERTFLKKEAQNSTPISKSKKTFEIRGRKSGNLVVDSPPPAPISKKRRKRAILAVDEDDEEEIEMESRKEDKQSGDARRKRRRLVRKLGDDFELVASENRKSGRNPLKDLSNEVVTNGVSLRTRSRRSMVLMEEKEEDDNGGNKTMTKKGEIDNGKAEKIVEKNVSVSSNGVSNKSGGKGSVSPTRSKSSPRLKQKSS